MRVTSAIKQHVYEEELWDEKSSVGGGCSNIEGDDEVIGTQDIVIY
jgi:hypothetical protein